MSTPTSTQDSVSAHKAPAPAQALASQASVQVSASQAPASTASTSTLTSYRSAASAKAQALAPASASHAPAPAAASQASAPAPAPASASQASVQVPASAPASTASTSTLTSYRSAASAKAQALAPTSASHAPAPAAASQTSASTVSASASDSSQAPTSTSASHVSAPKNSSSSSLSKLPNVYRPKILDNHSSGLDEELQGLTTLGINTILHRSFDSSASSETSLSSGEAHKGVDLSWYLDNKFILYVLMEMDPVDVFASNDSFLFSKNIIEASIQQVIEIEMGKLSSLDKCFIKVKASKDRPAFKFLAIPIKVVMNVDEKGKTREIILEACPSQTSLGALNGVSQSDMRQALLSIKAKFPVLYKEGYKRRDSVERFWCCSIREDNPLDDTIILSIEFQISYFEDKVINRDITLAWSIIKQWFLTNHQFDLDDKTLFDVKLVSGAHRTAQIEHRITHPKFYITYNAPVFSDLEKFCFIIGTLHGKHVRLSAKETPGCPAGFDMKFYCMLFDAKIESPRPECLKAVMQRVLDHITPRTTPDSMLKVFLQNHFPLKWFTVDDIRRFEEMSIINDIDSVISRLLAECFLCRNRSNSDALSISPHKRQWTNLTLYLPDKSSIVIQHKDCGIWIDSALGLPADIEPAIHKCFSIHIAMAYSSISRSDVNPWQLEQFMQYRYKHFKTALTDIKASPKALSMIEGMFETAWAKAKQSEIDPDFETNTAFWANVSRLEELASCEGHNSNTCMWSFLFLPTEFQQFHYLVVNVRPHDDGSGLDSVQLISPCYHFIADKPKTNTIVLMFEGSEQGHFSSLLFKYKQDDLKKKILTSAKNVVQVKFKKDKALMWDAIADIFMDLSLEDFGKEGRPQVNIHVPHEHSSDHGVDGEANHEDHDEANLGEPPGESQPKGQVVAPLKVPKKIEDLKRIVASVFDACNRADEFSDIAFDTLTIADLHDRIKELNGFLSSCRSAIARLPKFDTQESQDFPDLFTQFRSLSSMIANVTCIRDSCQKMHGEKSASGKKTPAKGGKAKESQVREPDQPLDLFCKVRSSLPVDDISDAITDGQLLGLFVIHPTPTFIASFYYSILHSSTNHQIIEEMEVRFQRKLSISKAAASELCQATRLQFDSVKANQMVRGGKTFEEYLVYKGVKSWDKIAYDNVLGELSLCSQVWKLNIALIWRHDNIWRLFVATNGGASPILTVVYAKTAVIVNASGIASFTSGTAGRFFPIDPINPDGDEWYDNELFTSQIPDSAPVEVFEAVSTFQKHIHKEHPFQSVVDVEGNFGSDTSSEITAEASQSELFNSFVDNDSVSQGSLPTPKAIRDIPLHVIVATVNQSMVKALKSVKRKRVVSSATQEDDDAQFAKKTGAAKASSATLGE
jgi:hypothetical protein